MDLITWTKILVKTARINVKKTHKGYPCLTYSGQTDHIWTNTWWKTELVHTMSTVMAGYQVFTIYVFPNHPP